MYRNLITLPTDKRELALVIDEHCTREQDNMSYWRTINLLAYYYLNGARRFDLIDVAKGRVAASWTDKKDGTLLYQSQELLSTINRVSARLSALDLRPRVNRVGSSLAAIRDRSGAQVVCNAVVSPDQVEHVSRDFSFIFATLGSCGLQGHLLDHPTIGLTADLEVVHPAEVMPFPSLGIDHTKCTGVVRQRWLPLSFLEQTYGSSVRKAEAMNDMFLYEMRPGEVVEQATDPSTPGGFSARTGERGSAAFSGVDNEMRHLSKINNGPIGSRAREEKTGLVYVVQVRELWLFGPRNTVARYVVTSGEHVFQDADLSSLEVYCPLSFDRFYNNGTFHGCGLFHLLYPGHRIFERMTESLYKNTIDSDRYGFVVMPTGSFNQNTALRDVGRGLRVLSYEPDVVADGFKPFAVQPWNAGDIPGKTAAFARELLGSINPERDLSKEKGRVDSMLGLSFLDEELTRPLNQPMQSMQRVFGGAYRAICAGAIQKLAQQPRTLPINQLTLDLAGVVIDPDNRTVSFSAENIPSVSHLRFSVQQGHPRSETVRKSEAINMAKMKAEFGQADWESFILLALEEGLDFAVWTRDYSGAYETVVTDLLMLYGDGETPGETIAAPSMSLAGFQRRVSQAFLASPAMRSASVDVQNAVIEYDQTLSMWAAPTLPPSYPAPEDAAMLRTMGLPAQLPSMPGIPTNLTPV